MSREQAWFADMDRAAKLIVRFVSGVTWDQFIVNEEKMSAVLAQIILLGEAANRFNNESQVRHPRIPWRQVIGMRNRVVREYDAIDWEIVWDVATRDVPALIDMLEQAMKHG